MALALKREHAFWIVLRSCSIMRDKASALHARWPCLNRPHSSVDRAVPLATEQVVGSNPTGAIRLWQVHGLLIRYSPATICSPVLQRTEGRSAKPQVAGSNPAWAI